MRKKFFILFLFLLSYSLYAPLKENFSGTSYSKIAQLAAQESSSRNNSSSYYGISVSDSVNNVLSLLFPYNVPTELLDQTLGSGGALSQTNGKLKLAAGTSLSTTSTVTTKAYVNNNPGQEVNSYFSVLFPTPTASGGHYTRYVGMFTDSNGFAIGTQNNSFGILHLQNGTAEFITQSNFNIDKLDGTGKSRFTLDKTKLNFFRLNFPPGALPIVFYVADSNGQLFPFHKIPYPNLNTVPNVYNSSLPMSLAVSKNSSGSGTLDIEMASWNTYVSGKTVANDVFSTTKQGFTTTAVAFLPVLSLKNKTTFQSLNNTKRLRLTHLNITGYSAGNQARIKLYKNSTLLLSSFSDLASSLSVAQIDTSATSVSAFGDVVFETGFYSQGSKDIYFKAEDIIIDLYPGETLTVTASQAGSGGITFDTTLRWEEF